MGPSRADPVDAHREEHPMSPFRTATTTVQVACVSLLSNPRAQLAIAVALVASVALGADNTEAGRAVVPPSGRP